MLKVEVTEMEEALISIIMPTYNRGYIIKKAIESVIRQTYSKWELIIIDDASDDNTEEIVGFIKDSRIIYIKNSKNKGANYSRNLGCEIAKGEYFAFLDSDNYWNPQKLERQVNILINSDDKVAFVFCRMEVTNRITQIIPNDDFDIAMLRKTLCKRNVIDTNTVLIKRSVFEKVGGFDNDMPRIQDWEIFFRIIVIHQYSVKYVPLVLDYNFIQPNSISMDDRKYIDAILLFLKKHMKFLDVDTFIEHVLLIKSNNLTNSDYDRLCDIIEKGYNVYGIIILHKLFDKLYIQTEYYKTLLNWKENMERDDDRTIFSGYEDITIAIYGLGRWGEMIYSELNNCGIKIKYGIDKTKDIFHGISVVKPDEIPDDIDVIVVSVFQQYKEIRDMLSKKFRGEIISIKEIINREK